jgi:hypothetical protein
MDYPCPRHTLHRARQIQCRTPLQPYIHHQSHLQRLLSNSSHSHRNMDRRISRRQHLPVWYRSSCSMDEWRDVAEILLRYFLRNRCESTVECYHGYCHCVVTDADCVAHAYDANAEGAGNGYFRAWVLVSSDYYPLHILRRVLIFFHSTVAAGTVRAYTLLLDTWGPSKLGYRDLQGKKRGLI